MPTTTLPDEVVITDLSVISLSDPKNVYESLINTTICTTFYLCAALEVSCLIFFVYHFAKKTPYFNTAYFVLLVVGYGVDLVSFLTYSFMLLWPHVKVFISIASLFYWYSSLFLGPWITLLAVNRFTSIIFWKAHKRIWSRASFALILGVALAYPFIVNGYVIAEGDCFFDLESDICSEVFQMVESVQSISTGVHATLSALLGIVTALSRRLNLIQIAEDKRKFEKHLLFQSILLITLFAINQLLRCLVDHVINQGEDSTILDIVVYDLFEAIMEYFYIYLFTCPTWLLFILS